MARCCVGARRNCRAPREVIDLAIATMRQDLLMRTRTDHDVSGITQGPRWMGCASQFRKMGAGTRGQRADHFVAGFRTVRDVGLEGLFWMRVCEIAMRARVLRGRMLWRYTHRREGWNCDEKRIREGALGPRDGPEVAWSRTR